MATKEELEYLLRRGELHIWWLDSFRVKARGARKLLQALSCEEREKSSGLVLERDRLSYGLAHGFLRFVLSEYAGVSPSSWSFARTASGKPKISRNFNHFELDFSISHSDRFIGCAVSKEGNCGLDVESSYRWSIGSPQTAGFLTQIESAALNRAPYRSRRFLVNQLWCAKEAYLKAKGVGFHTDPASIHLEFDVGPDISLTNVSVRVEPGWSFHVAPVGKGHHLAAVSRNFGPELPRFREMTREADELMGALG